MDKKVFKKSINNSNILVDVTKEQKELKHTYDRANTDAYDAEFTRYLKLIQPVFSHICMVNAACFHIAGDGVDFKRVPKTIEFVKNTSNAYLQVLGDFLDGATLNSTTNAHYSLFNLQRSIKLSKNLLSPVSHKIPAVFGGNHDGAWGNRYKDSNADPSAHLADALKVTHVEFGALYDVELPIDDNNRNKGHLYMYNSHMSGKGSGKASSPDNTLQKSLNLLSQEYGIIPDVIFGAHYHANTNGVYSFEVPKYGKNGKMIGHTKKDILVISESTLQNKARYGGVARYEAVDSNVYINDLSLVKNPLYNKKSSSVQPKYKVELKRFPMFKKNSDMYTNEAKQYLEDYKEPTHLEREIRSLYDNLPMDEALYAVEKEYIDENPIELLQDNGIELELGKK